MKETRFKEIIETVLKCDRCSRESMRMSICEICGRDVCHECSYRFGFYFSLIEPDFDSNWPFHVCKICWGAGSDIRQEIIDQRNFIEQGEARLLKRWKDLCQGKIVLGDK